MPMLFILLKFIMKIGTPNASGLMSDSRLNFREKLTGIRNAGVLKSAIQSGLSGKGETLMIPIRTNHQRRLHQP